MLSNLHIRNFAIIDDTEVDLDTGLTALTGETGAGKSILLGALSLVLGGRASSDLVKQGASKAEINATFNIDELPDIKTWLSEHDLEDNDECLLRRVITEKGKSRAYINSCPVTVQLLRSLGEQLLHLHGQHEHQRLGAAASQRALLDEYSDTPLIKQVADAFDAWKQADAELTQRIASQQSGQDRIDMLQFQLQEFDSLDTGGATAVDIESEHRWLANADRLIALGNQALQSLDGQTGAIAAITEAQAPLASLVAIDERMQEALDLIESASIQCNEAASMLRGSVSGMEHDSNRLAWLDEKLASLHRLAKKHHVDTAGLTDVELAIRDELDSLTDPSNSNEELQKQVDALHEVYRATALKLTRLRKRSAKKLSAEITNSMQTLAMTGGAFSIRISTDVKAKHRHGQDSVEFMVSPNPGVAAAPMAKVASGGELSRISLCIQLATIKTQNVATLIFDEVDTGIGGAVAETVGKLMRKVGASSQVLCVTHLPQVASQAHHHLRVEKSTKQGKTETRLTKLNKTQTRDEIARMLGGAKLTKKSQSHAQEMLDSVE
jgi:DNA repair protein RecN (Recombination protein N)